MRPMEAPREVVAKVQNKYYKSKSHSSLLQMNGFLGSINQGNPDLSLFVTSALALRLLGIAFRLGEKHFVGELELARLRVDVQQLHVDFVAFLPAGFLNRLQALRSRPSLPGRNSTNAP